VKVVARALMSMPMAVTPLGRIPALAPLGAYAESMFRPTRARVTMDGMVLPGDVFTGLHVASMSINLGGVLKFFGKADQAGLLNAIVGTPSPWSIVRNIPRMMRAEEMRGREILDRPCREMAIDAAGGELLEPVIDGEYYRNIRKVSIRVGPRVRIPKVVSRAARA
jgi:diacylglycerol kinase family enzyme